MFVSLGANSALDVVVISSISPTCAQEQHRFQAHPYVCADGHMPHLHLKHPLLTVMHPWGVLEREDGLEMGEYLEEAG
jgi:hypothetical protein